MAVTALSMVVIGLLAQAPGCTRDTDCKGEHVDASGVIFTLGAGIGFGAF